MPKVKAVRNFCHPNGRDIIHTGQVYDTTELPADFVSDTTFAGFFVYISERPPAKMPEGWKEMQTKTKKK